MCEYDYYDVDEELDELEGMIEDMEYEISDINDIIMGILIDMGEDIEFPEDDENNDIEEDMERKNA